MSFEPGMKEWMRDWGWEWWACGRWIRECDTISRVIYARLVEWDRKLIPKRRWCIAKWAMRRCGCSTDGDERRRASTMGVNRDQTVQISRLSSGESIVR